MPVALASAVPVKTDHGATSPHPTTPALVVIFTMAPGIESSMSPTPCRRFILSGHLTTSTATPVIRNSLMTDLGHPNRHDHAGSHDFILSVMIRKIAGSRDEVGAANMATAGGRKTIGVIEATGAAR